MNIYRDYIEATNYDILDVLETYEDIINELEIDISTEYLDDNAIVLQEQLKTIIVKKAQDEEIIPENWDIDECFNLDRRFAIIFNPEIMTEDEMFRVVSDFKDWCGIDLQIINE